ncbi:serine hydrolase domain-containing protein [Allorhizocola rhizosphaerae]|uniref:serine hydrolase domain-containing protein n=1 Tax=Allorhizocola rhizosphaerae TaxID=1872709 RepID=UPI0013C2FA9E|nr:serine hydrolase domain-containing protein [Allorhizocola rhizosphaerae]
MLMDACAELDGELRHRPEFAHTSHLLVMVGGQVVHDAHYHGPEVADVFSIAKSVVATLAGIAVRDGLLSDLDTPVERVLDELAGRPCAGQTLRHLLTMTRGSEPDDIDEVMALPAGWLARIADAPTIAPPGTTFRYDDGAAHLFGAALARLVGMPLADYAARELFAPLGIARWHWPRDPDGLDYGFAHLRLSAHDLAKLGTLWLDGGAWRGRRLMDPAFANEMVAPQSVGGWPEDRQYGYLMWIDEHGPFAGGWAGQHVTIVPEARAIIVTTGDPRFDPGPPPTDQLPAGWRPARELAVERLPFFR